MKDGPEATMDAGEVLAGGGEMGARMRAMDWSATPLGPVARWPQALRTCVRILLTSRQPMWLGWGDDLTFLYNDAYRSIVGGKHPDALGRPAAVVWREIWHDIAPRLRSTLGGQEGTYDEALLLIMERNGYPEETYYTFSYSAVPDDAGGVGGILCANTDDTRRIIDGRQLALLRELASAASDARTIEDACTRGARALEAGPRDLPFALLYLIDSERHRAILAGTTNIARGHPAAPGAVALDDASRWPIGEVIQAGEPRLITDLDARFGPLPSGAWTQPPRQAVALPIAAPGETGRRGVLIAGLNPYRLFDDDYRGFLGLVAGQIAAAIVNAQAYEEERRRVEALAELDRAKTIFFSNVSHELRTPLTLLLGPIEDSLTDADHPLPPAQRERQEIALRNAVRLLRLVNTLLDFSRIEAGRVRAAYEPTDLATYTAELASTFRSAVERAGVHLVVECPPLPDGVAAYVDREMWEKIVFNLLSNAFKFTFEGEIRVALHAVGDRIELEVRDSGTGIAPEELPRLFERFHRVQGARARTHEGTGIGLALVQELVKLHRGEVRVESTPGVGTAFTISIPSGAAHLPPARIGAAPEAAPTDLGGMPYVEEVLSWLPDTGEPASGVPKPAVAPGLPPASPAPAAGDERPRVLLADDNRDMREYVARLLRARYVVEAVADGESALAAARARPPDLVLSDVMMPRLDGFGLVAALRADPRTRDVPVVLLSARTGEEAKVEGLQVGANDYLIKPFSASELLARVETHLALARARAAVAQGEQAERRRLYDLFMQAPAAIAVLRGPEHTYDLANPRYQRLLGDSREIIGRPIRQALPELEGQGIFELLDQVYASGERFVGEEVAVQLDRGPGGRPEEAIFNFVYEPLRDADGRIDGIFVHALDVTDQVRARRESERLAQELTVERDRFAAIFEQTSVGIAQVDLSGRFMLVNDQYCAMLGRTREQLLGTRKVDVIHPQDRDASAALLAEIARGGRGGVLEKRYVRPDGSEIWASSEVSPVNDPRGQPRAIVVVSRDITAQKLAERALRRRMRHAEMEAEVGAALTGSGSLREQLQRCAEAITDHLDAALARIWTLNEADQKLELQASAVPVDSLDGGGDVAPPDDEAIRRIVRERRPYVASDAAGEPGTGDRGQAPRRGPARFAVAGYPMLVGDRALGVVAVSLPAPVGEDAAESMRTVASTIALGIERARAEERKHELDQQKEQFLAAAAHDLRTPLTVIQGMAQLLQRRLSRAEALQPAQAAQALAGIEASTRKAAGLLDELLDVSRLEATGVLELRAGDIDLVALARRAVDDLQLTTRAHTLTLKTAVPALVGEWDGQRLERVVANLLSNAIKYSPNGGEITVSIGAEQDGGGRRAVLAVQDPGIGIREADLERIFDRFQRGANVTGRISGSGIGLSYAREIVVRHGGDLTVRSAEGAGSTFTVRLPLP